MKSKKIFAYLLSAAIAAGGMPVSATEAKMPEALEWFEQSSMNIVEPHASQYSGNPLLNILDGNSGTFWETDWSGDWVGETFPEEAFTIDLGEIKSDICQVKYTPRNIDINGKVNRYQVLTGETLDDMRAVAGGDWKFSNTDRYDKTDRTATFSSVSARYITLKVYDTAYNIAGGETKKTISCAEFNIGRQKDVAVSSAGLEEKLELAKSKVSSAPEGEGKQLLQNTIDEVDTGLKELAPLSQEQLDQYTDALQQAIDRISEVKTSVVYVPSAYASNPASNMLDKDTKTFFETNWSVRPSFTPGDYIVFDLGEVKADLARVKYTPRQDSANGRIIKHKIYTSSEDLSKVEFTGKQEFLDKYFTYQGAGTWDSDSAVTKTATFNSTETRYVAVQALTVGGDGSTITCAEIEFDQEAGVIVEQGTEIPRLVGLLKELRENATLPAVMKAIDEQLARAEDSKYTQEGRASLEKELQDFYNCYANVGNVSSIKSGQVWLDTEGVPIQAHGGGVLFDEKTKTYYWYGEHKGADNIPTGSETGNPGIGIGCYSSKDLYNWKNEGVALPVFNNPQLVDGSGQNDDYPLYLSEASDIYKNSPLQEFPGFTWENGQPVIAKAPFSTLSQYNTDEYIAKANTLYDGMTYEQKVELYKKFNWNKVVERPKVIYNEATGKYVMWWHQDGPAAGRYTDAMAGIAISDSPAGPFKFLNTKRLLPANSSRTGMLRDMTLFVDDDGTGYVVYSSEENATTIIHKLNPEYTDVSGTTEGVDYVRVFPGIYREAPAMFKDGNTYYMVTSGQSGWHPNACKYSYSEGKILTTDWSENKPFSVGDTDSTTFRSQSTNILPYRDANGQKVPGQYIYMGDRWKPNDLKDSRYIWLPFDFDNDSKTVSMEWKDSWTFEEVFGVTERVEKNELKTWIEQAASLKQEEYTTAAWKSLEAVLRNAEQIYAKEDATQDEVDSACSQLKNAIEKLVKRATSKNALRLKIAEVSRMVSSEYTPESWKILKAAYDTAKAVAENVDATQTEVNQALSQLDSGIRTLQKAPKPVKRYTITYVLNKGKNNKGNPSGYTTKSVKLLSPSRKGYSFTGWYTDKKLKNKIKTISAASKKNYTVYAGWKKVTVSKESMKSWKSKSSGKLWISYKKISGASGYQIRLSTDKKYKVNRKTVDTRATSKTITKLKKNRNYYVQVRAYKRDSAGQKIYGKFSTLKRVKVK